MSDPLEKKLFCRRAAPICCYVRSGVSTDAGGGKTGIRSCMWIYNVESNEELDLLLAMSPVYNYAKYDVLPLAEIQIR